MTALIVGAVGLSIVAGLIVLAVVLSRKLGKAKNEIKQLEAKNVVLEQALEARVAADPDLSDLRLSERTEDDPAA